MGYGKTEVAIRAAFKAVQDGKQAAMLCPTTVLAQQHYATFAERLSPFPVKVEVLSRFRTDLEQRQVTEGLRTGAVDIVIGTHRLIQKDIAFKDLGLMVIDDEQRFGVAQKERFKQLRREVDVLTMSATPIPRTFYMALAGLRDMSTISTPPELRQPVRTFVSEYSDDLVRQAVLRELDRDGQVFFVHNRVRSIDEWASRIQELVPEARVGVGHGQMPEDQLAAVMTDFLHGKIDVLVCTTIIEAGLDIPSANTLIAHSPELLGLSQMYQLRGRVGRGGHAAYAYFLVPRGKRLSEAAAKRLKAILAHQELGAGFRLAMKDLEIRGAGNILGPEQSGHVHAVGFDLYCRLLEEAVEELRQPPDGEERQPPPPPQASVDLPLPAFIPQEYVPDLAQRLGVYQRLARTTAVEEVDSLGDELRDRFGPLPEEVEHLLYVVRIKILAGSTGVDSVAREGGSAVLRTARAHGRRSTGPATRARRRRPRRPTPSSDSPSTATGSPLSRTSCTASPPSATAPSPSQPPTPRGEPRSELMTRAWLSDWAQASTTVTDAIALGRLTAKTPLVVSLDGRSGSGKSTLASLVAGETDAAVLPVDDFYSAHISDAEWDRMAVEERWSKVFDWAKFRSEAVVPLLDGQPARWHPLNFDAGPGQPRKVWDED